METINNPASSSEIECKICHIKLHNKKIYTAHIMGKRHKWATEIHLKNERNKANNGSSLVSENYPKSRVYICHICNVQLHDQKSYNSHIAGRQHQLFKGQLNNRNAKSSFADCGIFVTGFPPDSCLEELVSFFAKFGNIDDGYYGQDRKYLIIEFRDPNIAKSLVDKTFDFKNFKLKCTGRKTQPKKQYHEMRKEVEAEEQAAELARIISGLRQFHNFHEQTVFLFNEIGAPLNRMIPKYNQLFGHLTSGLWEVFPKCRARPFGSTITGLAFKDSDVDVYIEVFEKPRNPPEPFPTYCVKKARKALLRNRLFTNVIAIPWAKTPIVKCVHSLTGIKCDFNFKSPLGVCNSALIDYLLSTNDNLRPLVMILKYWAKIHNLSGQGRFTNYCLVLMCIFYLQQQPAILPPIRFLQSAGCQNIHDGWNAGFNTNYNFTPFSKNVRSIPKLLEEFFTFYASFDYTLKVICPLLGTTVIRTDFLHPEQLPIGLERYKALRPLKIDSAICLQDPFELCYNVGAVVPPKILQEFIDQCKVSVHICETTSKAMREWDLLPSLLEEKPKKVLVNVNKDIVFTIRFSKIPEHLEKNIPPDCPDKDRKIRTEWFKTVSEFITAILINVFHFGVNILPDAGAERKSQKLEGQNDIHDNDVVDCVIFQCQGKYNLWDRRKQMAKHVPYKVFRTYLEKEIELSTHLCDTICKKESMTKTVVDFQLSLNAKVNPTQVEVLLRDINSTKANFKQMGLFLSQKIPIWFEKQFNSKLVKV